MTERFSASVAGRHMACHASAHLEDAIPGYVPPVVDEMKGAKGKGTNIHTIFELGFAYPQRDIENIAKTFQYVADLRRGRRFKVLVEQEVKATWLKAKPKTKADLVLYNADELHILDPKTGRIPVPCVENEQLMFYAACFAPLAPKAKGVTVHILQPWDPDWDPSTASWWVSTTRLKKFMDDAIATEAAIAAGSVSFGPSDHCKFCPANPHSRGDKGSPLCPTMLNILYPSVVDEDAILNDL